MVTWTADKDAQLLLGIFEFQEIKASAPLLQHLANKIGEGCTPKAVSHRLNNLKKTGKTTPGATPTGTPTKGAAKAATDDDDETPKAKAKPRGRPRASAKKNANPDLDGPGSDDENGYAASPIKAKGVKRGRKSNSKVGSGDDGENGEDEEEEEKAGKKIKVEAGEDFSMFRGDGGGHVGVGMGMGLDMGEDGI